MSKHNIYKRRLLGISFRDPDKGMKVAGVIFRAAKDEDIDLKKMRIILDAAFIKVGQRRYGTVGKQRFLIAS